MNPQGFKLSVDKNQPPEGMSSLALEALWHQATGDWDAAHQLAQSDKSPNGCLVHAYLHRVEGNNDSAEYWYRIAGKPVCTSTLADEWDSIVEALLL